MGPWHPADSRTPGPCSGGKGPEGGAGASFREFPGGLRASRAPGCAGAGEESAERGACAGGALRGLGGCLFEAGARGDLRHREPGSRFDESAEALSDGEALRRGQQASGGAVDQRDPGARSGQGSVLSDDGSSGRSDRSGQGAGLRLRTPPGGGGCVFVALRRDHPLFREFRGGSG